MKHTILMRTSLAEENEKMVASLFFNLVDSRTLCPPNSTIIGRYSCLPYYKELENDLKHINSNLINSFQEHQYVADIQNWYYDLEEYTPKTWFRLEDVPLNEEGSFVLKGETNSRKNLWKTHMFAENRKEVMNVACRLMDDSLLSSQKIYVRKYEKLISYGDGVQGLPITNEWRYFVLDGKIVGSGYYWSEHLNDVEHKIKEPPKYFMKKIINRIKNEIRFFVVDVGQKENKEWIVIELNDGQMSGLSCVQPESLYCNMKDVMDKNV